MRAFNGGVFAVLALNLLLASRAEPERVGQLVLLFVAVAVGGFAAWLLFGRRA